MKLGHSNIMKTKTLEEVGTLVTVAVQTLIETVKQDIELWRQVPFHAMLANGVSGYSSDLGLAYQCGIWEIRSPNNQIVYVDLETGELCYFEGSRGEKKTVLNSDEHTHLLSMYLTCLDKFDVQFKFVQIFLLQKEIFFL